jgi:hypothetical protein
VSLRTEYEFTLPRGYVDLGGRVHRQGTMRLATARDELEPLRHPTVTGPDDPRLTVLILARVVTKLGDLEMITPTEIEGLFAADLAFLQDFYGVINFGTQEEYEALLAAQAGAPRAAGVDVDGTAAPAPTVAADSGPGGDEPAGQQGAERVAPVRARVEEIPRSTG